MWFVRRIGPNKKARWQDVFRGNEDSARQAYSNEMSDIDPGEMLVLQSPDKAIQASHAPAPPPKQYPKRR